MASGLTWGAVRETRWGGAGAGRVVASLDVLTRRIANGDDFGVNVGLRRSFCTREQSGPMRRVEAVKARR